MSTDLDLIRQAANQMRVTAEKAAPGRYGFTSRWTTPTTMLTRIIREGAVVAERRGVEGDTGLWDMNHLSYWHPAVALAVARLLDKVLAAHDLGLCICDTDHEALAVARAFLKEDA